MWKDGLAQDCPCHPYKPRVFTLGVNDESIEAETEPQELDKAEEPKVPQDKLTQEELEPGRDMDQYVNDPYDHSHFEILDEYDKAQDVQNESLRFNMFSVVGIDDKNYNLKLASAKQLEALLMEEEKLVGFVDSHSSSLKSDKVFKSHKTTYLLQNTIGPSLQNKLLK